jgi:hypothetical protein
VAASGTLADGTSGGPGCSLPRRDRRLEARAGPPWAGRCRRAGAPGPSGRPLEWDTQAPWPCAGPAVATSNWTAPKAFDLTPRQSDTEGRRRFVDHRRPDRPGAAGRRGRANCVPERLRGGRAAPAARMQVIFGRQRLRKQKTITTATYLEGDHAHSRRPRDR